MAVSVVMPALEMAQETGKVVSWRKKEGEQVAKGEPLLEIETDKAVVEIEAPADGFLAGVKAGEGVEVPVGQTIAWIVAPGEAPPAEESPTLTGRRMSAAAAAAFEAPKPTQERPATAQARVSPKARRFAKEHGVDLSKVRGSGPGGEIVVADVEAAVSGRGTFAPSAAAAAAPARPAAIEIPGAIGRLMAERTTKSWTSVPHFFVARDVDAKALIAARDKFLPGIENARGVRLTHSDLLVAIVARVLTKHPRLNASWAEEGIRLNSQVNIGLAMAVNDGVVAAVIQNANTAELGEIAVQRRDLTERARANRLRPADLANATFTISNLGMFNVDAFSAIITPPQAAILAVARIADRVVPVDGNIGIRPMMTLTLSSDHRVVDGARAAQFMNDLAEALREPEKWLS
jgi:pyruvate dehydrogenase E2 component (dihydrolipoamide acetyltransferase)